MPVIKAKNSNGEWEVVASANNTSISATGSLKYAVVQAATDTTFDLSSYVAPGAEFLLMFFVEDNVGNHIGGTNCFIWNSRLNKIQQKDTSNGTSLTMDVTWENNVRLDFSYNYDTCIFSVADTPGYDIEHPHFTTGYLYYAG